MTASSYSAATPQTDSRWLDRKAEGFFWYEDPVVEEDPEPTKEEPAPAPSAPPPVPEPKAEIPPPPTQPVPLSAAWIRQNMQKYLDAAIDNPTPENVAAFLYLQRHVMDKSTAFMDATEEVTLGRSGLDQIDRRPLASFAGNVVDDVAAANQASILKKISEVAGLFFFTDGSAVASAQEGVIDMVSTKGFDVIRLLAPGVVPKTPKPSDRVDEGFSEQMGIESFPAVVLISADGTYDVLSQGAVSLQELHTRLLVGAKRMSLITDEEFNSTRPYGRFSHLAVDLPKDIQTQDGSVPIPQSDIIKAFNGGM